MLLFGGHLSLLGAFNVTGNPQATPKWPKRIEEQEKTPKKVAKCSSVLRKQGGNLVKGAKRKQLFKKDKLINFSQWLNFQLFLLGFPY